MDSNKRFKGFSWPIPFAFSSALTKCQFELGDIMYSDISAYEMPWKQAIDRIQHSITVTKSTLAKSEAEANEGVFALNWSATVELELRNHQDGSLSKIITKQGNLYSTLWKGDISLLDENNESLVVPLTHLAIKKKLQSVTIAKAGTSQFLIASDAASSLFKEKIRKIEKALGSDSKTSVHLASALPEFSHLDLLPTVEIVTFNTSLCPEEVEVRIKEAVYLGSGNQFSLRTHGTLK
jgi:hypothetical protein